MKTSNKILLIFFLSAIGVLGAVHLALYAKFSKGEIVTGEDREKEILIAYNGAAPSRLILKDNLNVTIIPSDTFSVEMDKRDAEKITCRRSGDSLILTGDKAGWIDPFDEQRDFNSLPVTVYCGHLENIFLSGCMGRINGRKKPERFTIDLTLKDASLRTGGYFEYYGNPHQPLIREYYDSIRVDASHSNLMIQQNGSIRSLYVQLADGSWIRDGSPIRDGKARIERAEIHYSDDSWLDLSGENLRKLK